MSAKILTSRESGCMVAHNRQVVRTPGRRLWNGRDQWHPASAKRYAECASGLCHTCECSTPDAPQRWGPAVTCPSFSSVCRRIDYHSSPRDSQQRHVRALRRRCRLRSPLYSLIVYVCIAMFLLFYIQLFSYFRCNYVIKRSVQFSNRCLTHALRTGVNSNDPAWSWLT